MCSAATCTQCDKTTWRGCGQHVDSVMTGVPTDQRCICDRSATTKGRHHAPLIGSSAADREASVREGRHERVAWFSS